MSFRRASDKILKISLFFMHGKLKGSDIQHYKGEKNSKLTSFYVFFIHWKMQTIQKKQIDYFFLLYNEKNSNNKAKIFLQKYKDKQNKFRMNHANFMTSSFGKLHENVFSNIHIIQCAFKI